MVEESEKRFEAIMNKLFSAPKSKPIARQGGDSTLSGKKRLRGSLTSGLAASSSSKEPSCRPWDRDDLIRRLSTFKSMTWFAKPQVVSPLACAMRGWINIDVDTIACESCDTRLLFSTPTSWTQQQVEKAALVFSLKLESGHKSLCPWLNNACSEQLAQFPTAPRADLIEDYKQRFSALSQLIALPVILPGTVSEMGNLQLDQFVREVSKFGDTLSDGQSRTEFLEEVPDSTSSLSYYQAQKLISIFGWEPHVLPYKVDFKDGHQVIKDVTVTTGQKQKVSVSSLCTDEATNASSKSYLDPSSIVLDCELCGASVGLWSFSTIQRPLEYLRFVGSTEVNDKNVSSHDELGSCVVSSLSKDIGGNKEVCTSTTTNASTALGFTIAGGPPPAKLNYSATISLPVIGHNLRSRLSVDSEDRDELVQGETETKKEKESNSKEMVEGDNNEQSSVDLSIAHDVGGKGPVMNYKTGFVVGHDKTLPSYNNATEFDPIKQHRHFCPWIMSTGKSTPGWQQTLSALEGHRNFSSSLNKLSSSILIEVDDPIESVRRLFQSPNGKRTKVAGGSTLD